VRPSQIVDSPSCKTKSGVDDRLVFLGIAAAMAFDVGFVRRVCRLGLEQPHDNLETGVMTLRSP